MSETKEFRDELTVYLKQRRLQIVADVDADGLKRLMAVLEKHEEILDMLTDPAPEVSNDPA